MRIVLAKDVLEPAWEALRAERDRRLAETDRTQLPDASLTLASQEAMRAYRQALRDLPANTVDPRNPDWPTRPVEERSVGPFLSYRQIVDALTVPEQAAILAFVTSPDLTPEQRPQAAILLGTLLRATATDHVSMSDDLFVQAQAMIEASGLLAPGRMVEVVAQWASVAA